VFHKLVRCGLTVLGTATVMLGGLLTGPANAAAPAGQSGSIPLVIITVDPGLRPGPLSRVLGVSSCDLTNDLLP